MKVVLIRSNPVSPEPPVEKVATELSKLGHEVTVLAWDRGSCADTAEIKRSSIYTYCINRIGQKAKYGVGFKTLIPFSIFQLKMFFWLFIHRANIDVVHAFDLDTGFLGGIFCKLFNKKMVYHILDYYADTHFSEKQLIKKLVAHCENWVINRADCTIICSEKRREQISYASPRQLLVIHNTPPNETQIDGLDIKIPQSQKVRLVYVGVLTPERMIEELMNFVIQHQNFELHIAGYGILESKVRENAKKYDNVFYYGKICYRDALSLERQCDVMTALYNPKIANHKFAAPNKFYESLLLGKPIVVVKNTAIDEYVEKYNLGCVIDYSEVGLKNGLLRLYEKRDEWERISSRSRQLYSNEFSWEIMAERLEKLYKSL